MSHPISRRNLLKSTAFGAAAASFTLTARSWGNVVGANEDIRMGVIGFHGRGNSHIDAWRKMKGVRLVALCDADKSVLEKGLARVNKAEPSTRPSTRPTTAPSASPSARRNGRRDAAAREGAVQAAAVEAGELKPVQAKGYGDLRKLLDDKEIDAISTATPNHWHALVAIWACQAGKDVYVEKPVSHNVSEGRKIVEAARKYDRIVQTGTQSRSNNALRQAFDWVRKGELGKIKIARGLCYKPRAPIGKHEGPQPIPKDVNYDLWCGPASDAPPRRNSKQFGTIHYDWHWFWEYGNGDIGNQGIHEMDKSRWALGKPYLAPRVLSVGGRMGYDDDAETPSTQFAIYDDGDSLLIFEVRGMYSKPRSGRMDKYRGQDIGQVIECEGGYLAGTEAFDNDGKKIKGFGKDGVEDDHFANFITAVRSRKVSDLNADILEGHLSSALCHLGNISLRLGKQAEPDEIESALKDDSAAMETYARFQDHLAANNLCLIVDQATLGVPLKLDPKTERFIDNDKANAMLTRQYRKPFVVPEHV